MSLLPSAPHPEPTYPQYPRLLAAARRLVPRFVDPANLYPGAAAVAAHGSQWASAILGYPYPGREQLSDVEHQLLFIANAMGIDPPLPEHLSAAADEHATQVAAAARRRADMTAADMWLWNAVVMQAAPITFTVHNGSRPHPRGGVADYVRHAVPTVDVYTGPPRRVRTHPAGRALCESARRKTPLHLGDTVPDAPVTCTRCLAWARTVRPAPHGGPS